ncbi:hypothetical protein HY492_02870 [Candidatus Woesearchaeota archaeon]|nr:hypothetical protein [Candidatus Woesearchaeota archaeon]
MKCYDTPFMKRDYAPVPVGYVIQLPHPPHNDYLIRTATQGTVCLPIAGVSTPLSLDDFVVLKNFKMSMRTTSASFSRMAKPEEIREFARIRNFTPTSTNQK